MTNYNGKLYNFVNLCKFDFEGANAKLLHLAQLEDKLFIWNMRVFGTRYITGLRMWYAGIGFLSLSRNKMHLYGIKMVLIGS